MGRTNVDWLLTALVDKRSVLDMSYLPTHLRTNEEWRIDAIQQDRINQWRRNESWRLALAREHREQEIRLQASYIETVRAS